MKIHNYGSDYAFQRKQKSEEAVSSNEVTIQPIVEPETKVELNVANQVQTRREGNVAVSPQERKKSTDQEISPESKQEAQRKEKKTAVKAKVQQDSQLQ